MIKLEFSKAIRCPWTKKQLEKIARRLAEKLPRAAGVVEVNLIGEKEIKKINRVYRGVDAITDVLSFAWEEDGNFVGDALGQIFICYPQIMRQARTLRISAREEFIRMFIHGLLHLLGYDHQDGARARVMFKLQERCLAICSQSDNSEEVC